MAPASSRRSSSRSSRACGPSDGSIATSSADRPSSSTALWRMVASSADLSLSSIFSYSLSDTQSACAMSAACGSRPSVKRSVAIALSTSRRSLRTARGAQSRPRSESSIAPWMRRRANALKGTPSDGLKRPAASIRPSTPTLTSSDTSTCGGSRLARRLAMALTSPTCSMTSWSRTEASASRSAVLMRIAVAPLRRPSSPTSRQSHGR